MQRKCDFCKEMIELNRENSEGVLFYNKKYYHEACFIAFCNKKIKAQEKSKKESRFDWEGALKKIPKLQKAAQERMIQLLEKDDIYHFILDNYGISKINNKQWEKLDHIYNGTYDGLSYAIGPVELLEEWKYYMPELMQRRANKQMTGVQAFPYDLAILLSRNAEYRAMLERRKLEEQARETHKATNVNIDEVAMELMQRNANRQSTSNRRADLFKEVMSNGN